MLTKAEADLRVDRGARWLDQQRPGWYLDVDPFTLELSNCFACVFGQLYGGYGAGLIAVGWLPRDFRTLSAAEACAKAVDHGFTLTQAEYQASGQQGYRWLTDAWVDQIGRRRLPDRVEVSEDTEESGARGQVGELVG